MNKGNRRSVPLRIKPALEGAETQGLEKGMVEYIQKRLVAMGNAPEYIKKVLEAASILIVLDDEDVKAVLLGSLGSTGNGLQKAVPPKTLSDLQDMGERAREMNRRLLNTLAAMLICEYKKIL